MSYSPRPTLSELLEESLESGNSDSIIDLTVNSIFKLNYINDAIVKNTRILASFNDTNYDDVIKKLFEELILKVKYVAGQAILLSIDTPSDKDLIVKLPFYATLNSLLVLG